MIVTIKGKEFTLKYTNRALIIYEEILGKTLTSPKTLKEIMVLFYSIILANIRNEIDFSFDDFIDWTDENQKVIIDFTKWLKGVMENQNFVAGNHLKEATTKAKKQTKSKSSKN